MSLNYSLGDYVSVVADRLTPEIVGDLELSRIRQLTDKLPGELSTFFGFECPLDTGRHDADFLFCSNESERQAGLLANPESFNNLPDVSQSAAWQKVHEFCKEWQRPGSASNSHLQNIWLEFDVGQSLPPWHPSIFFGLDPAEYINPEAMSHKVLEVLPMIDSDSVAGERLATLRQVMQSLPEGAHIFQVGVMLSRKMPAIRVCIRNIKAGEVTTFLEKLAWNGDIDRLKHQLKRFDGSFESVDIDLDVGAELGQKVGLEFAFGNTPSTLSLMTSFLNLCVDDGLVERRKADGLLAYNGLVHDDTNQDLWPAQLRKQSALIGGDMVNLLACWIHHVKIDFKPGETLSAKAYLAAQPGRASRSDLLRSVEGAVTTS
jgi:hypothetical protein